MTCEYKNGLLSKLWWISMGGYPLRRKDGNPSSVQAGMGFFGQIREKPLEMAGCGTMLLGAWTP